MNPAVLHGICRTSARLAAALSMTAGLACGTATAQPPAAPDPTAPASISAARALTDAQPSTDGSVLTTAAPGSPRALTVTVHSAAMNTPIRLEVLPAPDRSRPAPTVYLLNGIDGGADGNWINRTDIAEFFAGKQVNVVVPFGGASSYFTDWRADDPVLGRQRWTTFLTEELPPIIDSGFGGNGTNAIIGISMAGTSVFQLALAARACTGRSGRIRAARAPAILRVSSSSTRSWAAVGAVR
ncbi:Mycolyl transferase 85B [Nocardia africana]|uniref:Mycolyl transferase 85B n=1 Tax=Nocardia africana TaxID=134964 RepID=A0A378WS89_9NOCA|nr:Mycolyl transferase 85B [Nocardia africana]